MADKIVIRIANPRPVKTDPAQAAPQVVVYHWHRIGAALLIVALLVSAIVAGVRHFSQPAAPVETAAVRPSGLAEPAPPGSLAPAETRPGDRPAPQPATGIAASSPPSRPSSSPEEAAGHDSTASPPARSAPPPAAPAAAPRPAPVAGTQIHSPAIRRIQLTSGVQDGEPVDEIGGVIPMNARGLVKVFLFMETAGLKGKVLFHDWYWKDKRIAHARVPVTRASHSAVTSKYIDRIMVGPWRVKVADERGTVYAEARFEVR